MKGQQREKRKRKWFVLDYCSLEAPDTNVSMVLASVTSWGRSFQSQMVLGRNEYCWYFDKQTPFVCGSLAEGVNTGSHSCFFFFFFLSEGVSARSACADWLIANVRHTLATG